MDLKNSRALDIFEPPARFDFKFEENPTKTVAEQMNEANINVGVKVNPQLLRLIDRSGFIKRGTRRHVYAMSTIDEGEIYLQRFILRYSETFQPDTLYAGTSNSVVSQLENFRTTIFPQPGLSALPRNHRVFRRNRFGQIINLENVSDAQKALIEKGHSGVRSMARPFLVHIEKKRNTDMVWLKIIPNPLFGTTDSYNIWDYVDTDELSGDMKKKTKHVMSFFEYDKVKDMFEKASISKKLVTSRSARFLEIAAETERKILVSYKTGYPAVGVIRVGDKIAKGIGGIPSRYRKIATHDQREISISTAIKLSEKHKKIDFLFHPGLADISSMSNAEAFSDERLKDYQQEAVGLHLSTNVGYLNACSPGLGKTIMQLTAMRERAKTTSNYRGIVLAEMNVLNQWNEEMNTWFPEAKKVITDNNHNLSEVIQALSADGPAVILMPYAHLAHVWKEMERIDKIEEDLKNLESLKSKMEYLSGIESSITIGSLILNTRWDDITADEAMVIRNNSSKQAKAAWKLRENSEVAVALTGTPINKAVKDIANLISWCRNDRKLFLGVNFDEQYDLTEQSQANELFSTFGPLVFRRDTTEIQDELPRTEAPNVLLLEPTSGERALIDTAENELRRCYQELLEALNNVETNKDNEKAIQEMKEELSNARKAWLGGQTLSRMATSDPQTVANSESVGATLLTGQGLVSAALQEVPTKRAKLVKEIERRALNQEQSLVFVEFEATATVLTETLKTNGIKAESFTGKNRKTRDAHRIAFQNGELDVLVITQAGERGLTLHKASAVYCYDLPWSLEKVIQRIGRAVRIGSQNDKVDIIFMVMKDTIEEKIATKLVRMAISSATLLDATRGVQLKNTEIMGSLGGLVSSISGRTDNKSLQEFGKHLLTS